MINMLIIEDEPYILKGLKYIIEEAKLPVKLFAFPSCEDALMNLENICPQIVLTDIMLGDKTGIDFIEESKRLMKDIKYIILTGHDNFEYAKSSIDLGVFSYFLKPVDPEKLIECIKSAIDSINDRMALNSMVLQRLIIPELQIKQNSSFKNICKKYYMLISYKTNIVDKNLSCQSLNHNLKGFLSLYLKDFDVYFDDDCILIASNTSAVFDRNKIIYGFKFISTRLLQTCGVNILFGLSPMSKHADKIYEQYMYSQYALDIRFFPNFAAEHNNVFYCDEPSSDKKDFINGKLDEFSKLFYQYDFINALNVVNGLISYYSENVDGIVHGYPFRLLLQQLTDIMQQFLTSTHIAMLDISIKSIFDKAVTLQDIIIQFKNTFFAFQQNLPNVSSKNLLVLKCVYYIESNFMKDISVEDIAAFVGCNNNYLSTAFNNIIGKSITTYINTLRISYSKILLLKTNYSLVDIASKIGFSDEKYYLKVFKKITGITPNQYRCNGENLGSSSAL